MILALLHGTLIFNKTGYECRREIFFYSTFICFYWYHAGFRVPSALFNTRACLPLSVRSVLLCFLLNASELRGRRFIASTRTRSISEAIPRRAAAAAAARRTWARVD